jgi:hypothetical protein
MGASSNAVPFGAAPRCAAMALDVSLLRDTFGLCAA